MRRTASVTAETQAVVGTLDRIAYDPPERQSHVLVGTAVFQHGHASASIAKEDHGAFKDDSSQRAILDLVASCSDEPVFRVADHMAALALLLMTSPPGSSPVNIRRQTAFSMTSNRLAEYLIPTAPTENIRIGHIAVVGRHTNETVINGGHDNAWPDHTRDFIWRPTQMWRVWPRSRQTG